MKGTPFYQLNLSDPIKRAIDDMGFENATEIQAQSIPILRQGRDLVGRSQTGTGKTIAFAIPAIESIDTEEKKNFVQVLILCPTRELAMQACSEIRNLTKYKHGVKVIDIYGGAPMTRQIMGLKSGANIVVGTPGRIMDHMRRKTLKLDNAKMVILDEADEMLSMGFKEDIETILKDVPENRQTVLFSATMPPSILELTKKYQKDPVLIEIDKKQPSVKSIEQCYYELPMGRKMDGLSIILRYYNPQRAMVFCNTKKTTDEITAYLISQGFHAEGLHGDMKQQHRTKVLSSFKTGKINILVATDVAARGIDVDDIDYVINYDIPQNTEYYIHRIGRTGRAGKSGNAITLCCGRKQHILIQQISKIVKSNIIHKPMPSVSQIIENQNDLNKQIIEKNLENKKSPVYSDMVKDFIQMGYDAETVAAVVLEMYFGKNDARIKKLSLERTSFAGKTGKISINIGRSQRVTPNHIVGAITEFTDLKGSEIGKIEIYDRKTIVSIPQNNMNNVLKAMRNCKICGYPVKALEYTQKERTSYSEHRNKDYRRFENKKYTKRRSARQ